MPQGSITERIAAQLATDGGKDRPGLWVHRSSHPERLVAGLATELSAPLADPFLSEVVSVPTHGVERWLSQSLSTRLGTGALPAIGGDDSVGDGVCAGIDFIALHRLLGEVVEQACGVDRATDPWRPSHAIWALLEIIDECADDHSCDDWFAPLREPFATQTIGSHRWSSADRVLGLFTGYAAERPDLLTAWRQGRNTDPDGAPLEVMERWQPELWRRLRRQLASDAPAGRPVDCQNPAALDPAARREWACAALTEDPRLIDLPDRLSIFGPSRLSAAQTEVIAALAVHRRVHLWLPQPSPVLWNRIAEARPEPGARRDDVTAALAGNLLNRRLGRDARELQVAVQALDFVDRPLDPEPDSTTPAVPAPGTVLARLQRSIELDVPVEEFAAPLDPGDRSIRFHSCHGAHRQVEVLRDEVLALLAADPTLEPRDVIVMCPDIEAFAPLLAAAFHAAEPGGENGDRPAHPAKRLRIRLADRSLRQLNPLLATLSRLFDLHTSRAGVSDLIDLCADPAVASRFGFREDDHERLITLAADAGIRWGLDAENRRRFSMQNFADNTWRFGVDRLLLGITTAGDGHWTHGGTVPVDDVDSGDALLIGRLAELVDRVAAVLDDFSTRHSLTDWIGLCRRALEALTATAPTEAWQVSHAWSVLADLGDSDALLDAGDLRALLADAFAGRPTRANFGTGALTICSMMPMRSVPHRVVITLGMDEGSFPRRLGRDGDDLRVANPRTGDRDPRSEDRQILLDAVLSAREKFVVIYSGASPHTGERRPACVPVLELRDAVTALCAARADQIPATSSDPGAGIDPWRQLERRHPLQPHSPRNFSADDPFSFDPLNHRAAAAHLTPLTDPPPTFTFDPLPPLPEFDAERISLELDDLDRFFKHPIKALLRRRGTLYVREEEETLSDENLVDPSGLDLWPIGQRMLDAHLAGTPLLDLREAELRRGQLPPGNLGLQILTDVASGVLKVAGAAAPWLDQPARSIQARVDVGRYRLTGMLGNIRGNRMVETTFSTVKGKQRLSLWLKLLLLTVARPEHQWTATIVGKRGSVVSMGPVNPHEATGHLNTLISLYVRGSSEPLVMPPNCAAEQAEAISHDQKPNLDRTWEFERDEAWLKFVGRWANRLHDHKASNGASQFDELARTVWAPILQAESHARRQNRPGGRPS